jgi:alkanesulfonate monooxygenase SsuD/methylene tetrahydromethanopterin reductase-like flavin-dependent oxidoreductase (luciferase family)
VAHLHLAVGLDGTGRHPASWREPEARPTALFDAGYWTSLVLEAERGLLDLVTIEDTFGIQTTGQVRGRLDAVMIAARVAPLTSHIGLVPTAVSTHTEPFHLSKAIATLDFASLGRAGVQVRTSDDPAEYALVGLREPLSTVDNAAEAADWIEVVRRLWDSWEDTAEIRDAATGRFVDRERLHHIDFEGRFFAVRGPSITPRPPQGQPLVVGSVPGCDLSFVTSPAEPAAGPTRLGDVVVFLDGSTEAARDRLGRMDSRGTLTTDARIFAGTPAGLADLAQEWAEAGLAGLRLLPGSVDHDLPQITRGLVPELQRRGAFRERYEPTTLRGLFGLDRPADRYAA